MKSAGPLRCLLSAAYDLLLLLAVLIAATFLFLILFADATEPPLRYFFQAYLLTFSGVYFVWFWSHAGQTLAMKTWRLKLITLDGRALPPITAWFRFFLATAGLAFFGVSWFWMLVDRDGCLLHDRLLGTRLIQL